MQLYTCYSIYPCQKNMSFCTRVQVVDLVLGHWHRVLILTWVFLKKECVHISAQRVAFSGTVSGHQVWTLHYFSACIKGNRTRLPARRLFVPLMSNSAFKKTIDFFVGIVHERAEKGVCSRRLGYEWTGPYVFNAFYFLGWVRRVHSISTKQVLRKGQKV